MARKIIITGGGGYIGSVSTQLFLNSGFEVVVIDNFTTGYKSPLKLLQKKFKNLKFYDLDLKDNLDEIFQQEPGIECVIHYAAYCSVDESMKDPHKYFHNNVGGTENLIDTMFRFGINKLIFSSTCATYGEAQYVPIDESHPQNPKNPYGQSKKMAEEIIKWYGELKDLRYVILRYFNVCGASDDGSIGDSKRPSSLLVQNAVRGALGIEPFYLTCPEVNTPDKTPVRDYINVVDLNAAHLAAAEYLINGGGSEIVNLGTGTGNSVMEVLKKVETATGYKFDLKKTEARMGEYSRMVADITHAKEVLGWEPKRTIETSVNSLVKWYKDHPKGWEE